MSKSGDLVPDYSAASHKAMYDDYIMRPQGICADHTTGRIIVTDLCEHEVFVLTPDLGYELGFGGEGHDANEYDHPWDVAMSDGRLCVTDQFNHRVHVTDMQGVDQWVFGSIGEGEEHLNSPCGLSCDASGHLYISDAGNKRIKVTDIHGTFVREFGRDLFDDVPLFNAVSSDGKVAVTTYSTCNIYLFTTSGQHIRTISTSVETTGVAFDDHGHLLVADHAGGRVAVMTETGDVVCYIGSLGQGPGKLKYPWGVAVTRDGDVAVCERGNDGVQLFAVPSKQCTASTA